MQIVIVVLTTVVLLADLPGTWSARPRSAARSAPASRTARWRRCSASMSTAPSPLTFVIGAALAAVAGIMYLLYYGVVDFSNGFVPA